MEMIDAQNPLESNEKEIPLVAPIQEKIVDKIEEKQLDFCGLAKVPQTIEQSVQIPSVKEATEHEPLSSSPPRKSARLSLKRGSSTDRDTPSPARLESPMPRRRSTRLSSITSTESSTPKPDDSSTKKMSVIKEADEDEEAKKRENPTKNENTADKPIAKEESNANEDDLVDELASAFVDEFLD